MDFDGCEDVNLWRAIESPNVFFTYSLWQSMNDLNTYRESDIFRSVWSKVKPMFNKKAEAWSLK